MGSEDEVYLFGFVKTIAPPKTAREVVEAMAEDPGVRFVAQFVGPFIVFAAAEHPTLEAAQQAIGDGYLQAGFRTEWSVEVVRSQVQGPKRGSPDYCAIVRVQARDDAETVLGRLDGKFGQRHNDDPSHTHFNYGAAVVTGENFDILVDLGSDSKNELLRTVLRDLREVEGVGRTATGIAYLPGNKLPAPSES